METPAIYGEHVKIEIDGSVYDTTQATLVGKWQTVCHGPNTDKPCTRCHALYRTKANKYFDFEYVINAGSLDTDFPKKQVFPLTRDVAEQLCKEKIGHAAWEQEFNLIAKKNASTVITEQLVRAIEKEREKTGKSVSAIINDALAEVLLK